MTASTIELNKFNDELLAFVVTCLFCGAIRKDELNVWSAEALVLEDAPSYLYDLLEFDEDLFKIFKVIGHVPTWEHTQVQEYALYGIAVSRGFNPFDMPISAEKALDYLASAPEVEALFRSVFSFVNWNAAD
ncbi:hypothetical protein [Pseudomonas sp. NPDC008258]|uniref:hypothetical protein n=1 Tax=Pseudomonas sp. NPDC008258 TaxID=3364418 RepID=UPI0036ECFF66